MASLDVMAERDPPWSQEHRSFADEFEELQRTLTAELEGLDNFVIFSEDVSEEDHLNSLSLVPERRQKKTSDSAFCDSPPPSPPPLTVEQVKMDTESSDTGLPSSQPPSYTSSRTPDLDYYPTKYTSSPKSSARPSAFSKYSRVEDTEVDGSGYPSNTRAQYSPDLNTWHRERVLSDGAILRDRAPGSLTSPPAYDALSPKPCPQSRGYSSSMPFLDSDIYTEKRVGRSHSSMSECSRTTNTSRVSLAKRAIHNSHHQHIDQHSQPGSTSPEQLDLSYIIQILNTSSNSKLLSNAAGCIQHLAFDHDTMKSRIRDAGGIPVLVRLLQAEQDVCVAALAALRNLSYGQQNNLNKIAIKDSHGVPLLVQLLKTSENFEVLELVTGVFWNLSSSEQVKSQILRQALEPIVQTIIVPQSGWKGSQVPHDRMSNIDFTTVFRNATGCLRNLSSAGAEGREAMRTCPGLVDSLLYTLRAVQGKNDVDNKAVENSVCVLRNLSYRLDCEVSPEHKYGEVQDWRSKGLGGGQFKRKEPNDDGCFKKKKNSKKHKGKENATPLPEHTSGVGLLWQGSVVRVYLDLLLECSNPDTLEGAAGALQNLTACSWEPAQVIRETVRKEKGLSVITSLLRMPNDPVVRSTAVCLRNLAIDPKNKALLGENALHDLVKRLPGGEGADGITDITIGAIISAIYEVVQQSGESCKALRDIGGITRLVEIATSTETYSGQCVVISNRVLTTCWDYKELRKTLKHEGWNISMSQRLPPPDKTDGLEYDDSKNQFKASYHNNNSGQRHHDTLSLTRHQSPLAHRPHRPSNQPPRRNQSPGTHRQPISPHPRRVASPNRDQVYTNHRSATIGRSFDPTLEYHRPERPHDGFDASRGHSLPARSLPPSHPLNSSYGVADSWV